MAAAPYSPAILGAGSQLTGEQWLDLIVTPLQADSVIMSMPGVEVHQTDQPLHIPILGQNTSTDSTIWAAPNATVAEFEGVTSELVLMGRTLNACKILVKISSESMRSSDALGASQIMILNQLRKAVDNALLQGNATAGITGLIPQAGTVVKHSRFVADGVTNATTTVTSATAAFTSADVGSFVTGVGIPAGATIASVTNATTIVLSAAATTTATGVTLTITTNYLVYDRLVDALTAAQDAYADPKFWIINSQTIGVLRKLKDSLGHPLLSPDTTIQGAEMILGRTVLPAPSAALPHGVAMLVDPRTIHVAVDVAGYMRIALEAFIANDQVGLLVVSRFDAGVTIPAGLVVIEGLGPN
ncbi:MAG: phage major capsid protein [Candidatus Dormibacteria bacterium]